MIGRLLAFRVIEAGSLTIVSTSVDVRAIGERKTYWIPWFRHWEV